MHSRFATLVAAVAVASGLAMAMSVPALAAPATTKAAAAASVKIPPRNNGLNEPIYWVHGIQLPGKSGFSPMADCKEFAPAISRYHALGATGPQITVAYYTKDKNCSDRIGNFSNKTQNLGAIGEALAWDIYNRYTKRGISVDAVGHSMGGLIIRAAITGVQKKEKGWPPRLFVEDVVLISTPNTGSGAARICGVLLGECKQMEPGSSFLKWLTPNPQSAQGTDWTLIGSKDDKFVNWTSAVSTGTPGKEAGWISAGHKVVYAGGQGLGHTVIYKKTTGKYKLQYWNFYTNKWITQNAGASPIVVARNANYYWRLW